ncbi:MAG: STAS domain-containing protein [Phycisphaerales bacterium]
MGIKDLFSRKQQTEDKGPESVLADSTHATVVDASGIAVATILCERYSEHESKPLEHDLLEAASKCAHQLAVDMSKVAMLASAGIGSLISIHQACTKAGGKLVIYGLDPNIAQLMTMTRMDKMLNIVDSRSAATQAIR